jgi:serine-type D-Ala-D-Ala carboxypeptidase (penicillin-binding protein 5/6)
MRIFLLSIVTLLTLLPLAPVSAQAVPELEINSKRYIVMDGQSGHVFAQKDARDRVPIASLTKVFTAVQALEMASPEMLITTDQSDVVGSESTAMGLGAGETYTLKDLIFGMMLPSGNDAAHAIARSLGGHKPGEDPEKAVERFMGLLNQRVKDMGLTDTNLITPSGWGVPGHHSSAWDVAAMMQHAIEFPLIVDAISTTRYTTSNGALTITNTNKLLGGYNALIGGKTGYDDDAGWCLVEVAESNDRRMIAVTLDGIAPDDWYDDNRVLLEYGFNQDQGTASSWDGDTVAWQNPAIAEMQRSAESDTAIAGGAIPEPADVAAAPVTVESDTASAFGREALPVALLSLVLILGARGALAWNRWPLGRARRASASGTTKAPEPIVESTS